MISLQKTKGKKKKKTLITWYLEATIFSLQILNILVCILAFFNNAISGIDFLLLLHILNVSSHFSRIMAVDQNYAVIDATVAYLIYYNTLVVTQDLDHLYRFSPFNLCLFNIYTIFTWFLTVFHFILDMNREKS